MVESIVAAVKTAQREWAKRSLADRLSCIAKTRAAIAAAPRQLAAACDRSNLAETLAGEVLPLADACLFLEKTAAKTLRPQTVSGKGKPQWLRGVRVELVREPLGVVLIVAPSNYPLMLPGIQALQALVAGNGVLIKPAPGCTKPAAAFATLLHDAGVDPSVVQVLPEENSSVEAAVQAGVHRVVLTGSAKTGRIVQNMLADQLIPSAMELSGCDAVFVTASADVERTVKCLAMGLRFNHGRTCIAPRRVFVSRSLLSDVEQRLKSELAATTISNPTTHPDFTLPLGGSDATAAGEGPRAADKCTDQRADNTQSNTLPAGNPNLSPGNRAPGADCEVPGPATLAAARLVDAAVSDGATILVDGIRRDHTESGQRDPFVASETVLANANVKSDLLKTDVFAPVMSIIPFDEVDDALAMNELCPYALGATIFSANKQQVSQIANAVNAGCVVVNDMIVPTADPRVPFGGRGESGFGVTRGTAGLLEMTQLKTIIHRTGNWLPHLDTATPYDADVLAHLITVMHTDSPLGKANAGISLAKAIGKQRRYRKQ